MKKYNIIYADPPWSYNDKLKFHGGGAESHYSCMSIQAIKDLPVNKIVDKDCILFLWCTYPMLQEGLDTIKAWGFKYKTIAFQWVKINKKNDNFFYGLGRWTRGNTECCLLATKGKPVRKSCGVFQIIKTPIEGHSKKPDIIRDKIVQLMGDIPRIELFARQRVEGWDAWGNEVTSDIDFNNLI